MSRTIDQRVVEMRFDNQQFERGVSTSLSTLDKLKRALRFDGASKGLEDISAAAKGVNFAPLTSAVETVQRGFSALEVIGVTALANITNSAVNAGKQLVKSLTIDQVTAGWDKLSQKTTSVATLVAQGYDMSTVEEQLGRLNWYTDETSYNFTDMVENISKFTATGKGLEESVTAMEGIANWAALSGQNANTASRAMYQLSQAMGAGVMRMEDYKSIQNVSMDTDEFRQKALDAAVALGTLKKNADGTYESLINNQGAFTKSQFAQHLTQDAWFTSDVMMKVFNDYSSAVDQIYEYAEEKGITASQAIEELGGSVDEFGLKAFLAAQEAKTFGDAIDATKDAVSTGWMNTFELIFGNYEEQRVLWTDLANVMYDVFASGAEARNELLSEWKDLGGRDLLVESFWNTWNAVFGGIADDGTEIVGVLSTVKTAFREIFPEATAQDLYQFTEKLRDLTEKFKMTDETAENLNNTFEGVFAVFGMAKQGIEAVLKGLAPLGDAFLDLGGSALSFTGSIGEWLAGMNDALKSGEGLAKITEAISSAISKAVGFIERLVGGLSNAGEASDRLSGSVSDAAKALEEFGAKNKVLAFLQGVGEAIGKILSGLGTLAGKGFSKLGELFKGFDIGRLSEIIDTISFGALTAGIIKFVSYLRKPLEELGSIKESVIGVIDAVGERFSAMEKSVNAKSLLTIAGAIGILAASLLVIASIDEKKLGASLASISLLFGELLVGFALFGKIGKVKGAASLMLMATSLLILSAALKTVSTLTTNQLVNGLSGLAGSLLILFTALKYIPKDIAGTGAGLVVLAMGIRVLASAMQAFGKMSGDQVITAFATMGGSLMLIGAALRLMPANMAATGAGLLVVAIALGVLAGAMRGLGSMSAEQMGKSLIMVGGALVILSVGLKAMTGTIGGSAALVVAAAALAIMAPALAIIGSLSIASIGKALLILAGSFTILGIAGAVLAPLVPTILGLSGAVALLGLAVLGIGAGLLAAGAGLSSLAVGLTALAGITVGAAASIAASITTIGVAVISLIPLIIQKLGEGIVAFCVAIGNGAVAIGEAFRKIFVVVTDVVLTTLVEYTPRIVDLLFDFLIEVLNGLAARMPEFVAGVMNVVGALFKSIGDAIRALDTETMLQDLGIIALITGLIVGLSFIGPLIPGAMAALLGVAAFIAELSLVLAAMGAINQIPGLNWLIGEGGKLLQSVGTAIGGFVGGIVGGFMSGVSSQFPKIGKDLAGFMTNVKPFIEGTKTIDSRVLKGVTDLSAAILVLTGTELLSGIASWFSGKSSLTSFANELVPFGQAMKDYSLIVSGVDANVVSASTNAAKALVELSNNLPKQGGVAGWFKGESDMASFGMNLVTFGEKFAEYADKIQNVDTGVVAATSNTTRAIVEISNAIPHTGLFSGNTSISEFGASLSSFGYYFNQFYGYISAIDASALSGVVAEMNGIVSMARGISDIDTSKMSGFGMSLKALGNAGLNNFLRAFTGATTKIQEAANTLTDVFIQAASVKKLSFAKSFSDLAQTCIDSLAKHYSDFYQAGAYLVQGFANGISTSTYMAEARARAMAAAAAAAARSELQINSPSKVGEEIGKFFGLGFVNAIGEYQQKAYRSSAEMANAARSGLTAAATKIQNAIDGNLDTQPVIRPVLDLRNIQAGSRYLNGLIPNGGIHTVRGMDLSSRISTDVGGSTAVNPRIQNEAVVPTSNTTNTFNIYGTNAQEIAQEVSKILNQQVQRRERAWV